MIKLPLLSFMPKNSHYISEVQLDFKDFLKENGFEIGDEVMIENHKECMLPLNQNEYCLTFDKGNLFIEESFSKEECEMMFSDNFNY